MVVQYATHLQELQVHGGGFCLDLDLFRADVNLYDLAGHRGQDQMEPLAQYGVLHSSEHDNHATVARIHDGIAREDDHQYHNDD